MANPVRHRLVSGAAQHGLRNNVCAVGSRTSSRFWRRSAIALLGVALFAAASTVREFDIRIHDRQVVGGASTIRVNVGETVLLRWHTDEKVSVHVHGYDIQATLAPESSNVIRFEAAVAGRFPIVAHEFGAGVGKDPPAGKHHEVTLLYLEVLPG